VGDLSPLFDSFEPVNLFQAVHYQMYSRETDLLIRESLGKSLECQTLIIQTSVTLSA